MLRYTDSRYKRNEREDGAVWDNNKHKNQEK